MFVRFRNVSCDGIYPKGASPDAAHVMCLYPWRGVPCPKHCHAEPRCRWRIGDEQLTPYRLKIVLVENSRVDGKVRQETIAVLGSVEAAWLPGFWDGIDPDRAAELKVEDWELRSLRVRTDFWKGANRRLARLTNRLGPDLKRIRMAVHRRVPYPMEEGIRRLELLEAKAAYDSARQSVETSQRMVASGKKAVKAAQKALAGSEKLARWESLQAVEASNKLVKLSSNTR